MQNETYWYHALAVAAEANYSVLARLKNTHSSWRNAWDAYKKNKTVNPESEWQSLEKRGVSLILSEDVLFPPLLREIPHPPFGLYVRNAEVFVNATQNKDVSLPPLIAIVGTRKATPEGKRAARQFARSLAQAGCAIVSGLALGIDAEAHEGALETNGTTVGVLGCGIDHIYPSSHARLGERMLKNKGAIVSEYPLGTPSVPYRFLERNRIISGLAKATIVIEAPERSGSLATARFAGEQNRDVFAVPGIATSPYYRGSHNLIRQGATLVTTPEEVLMDLGILRQEQNINAENAPSETLALQNEDAIIFRVIKERGKSMTADEVIEKSGLSAANAHRSLGILAIQGVIKETSNGFSL